jgi:hypothetical protein
MKDPEYLAETAKLGWDVDPHTGEELQEIVKKIDATPPELVETARKMLKEAGIDLQ